MANEEGNMVSWTDYSQNINVKQAESQTVSEQSGNVHSAGTNSECVPGKVDERKLFVGGLTAEITAKELGEYFGKFGDIESVIVKMDPITGASRGFGFILFSQADAIDRVLLSAGQHSIKGKKIDPRKAKVKVGKVFVGGFSSETSENDIQSHFNQFGKIVKIEMPLNKQTNQHKGFCFITFESDYIVKELLKVPKQIVKGKEVDLKKAVARVDGVSPGLSRGRGRGRYGAQNFSNHNYGSFSGYGQMYDGGYPGSNYYGAGYGNYYDFQYPNYGNYDYNYGNYNGGYPDRSIRGGGTATYHNGKQRSGPRNPRHHPYQQP